MRILVMTRFYRNGQTTHVLDLCVELLQLGHRVLLAIADLNDVVYLQWIKLEGIPHLLTANPDRLYRRLSKWQPDIIHNHSAHTLPTAIQLGRQLHIPTVSTVHYLDFAPRELLEEQQAVILISREMQARFADLRVPTFLVENGVRLGRLKPRSKRWRQLALILAQVTPDKRDNFLQLSQSLLNWGWDVLSAGNWQYPGVKYLGWTHEVTPLLKQANLVVGTGRAIREGMAAAGFTLGGQGHPIIPVMIGDAKVAGEMARRLLALGLYVVAFSYPVVPQGKARIRTQMSAAHSDADIDRAVAAFIQVGREMRDGS